MFDSEKYREIMDKVQKRAESCKIIAISKNHPKESVIEALKIGVNIFGENRVVEAKEKFKDLKEDNPNIQLHLTGPLQSNKVKQALSIFDVFHTLDREKIAIEFSKHRDKITNKKIFIQVNTGKEQNKSGVYPTNLSEFINFCRNDLSLTISGLMCIPPVIDDPKLHFKMLQELAETNSVKELSIGMSNDYQHALDFKPSYIRLGTILFGKRN